MAKKLSFTEDELKRFFSGEWIGVYSKEAKNAERAMRVHADGIYPREMIEEQRPNEPMEVKIYRERIWKAKTKPYFSKILNSLSKIRRSTDWVISYPDEEFTRIPENEDLESYCEENYPFFTSITNWVFSVLLREYCIDPNAVLLVMPLEKPELPTDLVKPIGIIFNSENVVYHKEDDYCILINPNGSVYQTSAGGKNTWKIGKSFYVVTTMQILKYDQQSDKNDFVLNDVIEHNLNFLPAIKLGGVLVRSTGDEFLYESRIAGVLPSFDEALREYSDLQASKIMHIYAERWEISTNECKACNGTGRLPSIANGEERICHECGGQAVIGSSPYSKLLLSLGNIATVGQQLPIPPAGYVEKDVQIVKIQSEGVAAHIRDGLSAINMEYLFDVPLAQSGIAKQVDRDETNNFVHSVAEDIVSIMDWLYKTIAHYRYGIQYSTEDINNMLPSIPVPEHFDIFSTQYLEEDIKNAKEHKLNPIIVSAMEVDYAGKKFYADPAVKERLRLILELDPLPNVSEEDKTLRLTNEGISKIDYVISSNIQRFIQRALIENERFSQMPYEEQRLILEEYAQEIIDSNDTGAQLKQEILNNQNLDNQNLDNQNLNNQNLNNETTGNAAQNTTTFDSSGSQQQPQNSDGINQRGDGKNNNSKA